MFARSALQNLKLFRLLFYDTIPKRPLFGEIGVLGNKKDSDSVVSSSLVFEVSYTRTSDFAAEVSPLVGRFDITIPYAAQKATPKVKVKLNNNRLVKMISAEVSTSSVSEVVTLEDIHSSNESAIVSMNLAVSSTREELNATKLIEQTMSDHEKKADQSKKKRKKLESCVHTTCIKFQNGYKLFASDSKNDEIRNTLQDIEDWLFEHADGISIEEE